MIDPSAAGERPLFAAELSPHRSLSPRGFGLLMGILATASLALGLGFFLIGAWPVVGFLGLDVLLVYVAFRASYGQARLRERLELWAEALVVSRLVPRRPMLTWRFQPYWLKVSMPEPARHDSQLVLTSHGRRLVIGSFLSPPERAELARALRGALADLNNVHHR